MVKIGLGRPRDSIPLFQKSLRLNPKEFPARRMTFLGIAHILLDENKRAAEILAKAVSLRPGFTAPYYASAAVFGNLGRIEEAREMLAELKKMARNRRGYDSVRGIARRLSELSSDLEPLLQGLRRAGMPEN